MKQTLRKIAKANRSALSQEEKINKSIAIVEKLLPLLDGCQTIGIYLSTIDEVDVSSLFLMYSALGLPKVRNDKEMDFYLCDDVCAVKEGAFHILEPESNIWMDPSDFDALIIPIVAFDETCHRIGQGKGYYDRYLKHTNAKLIGVGFECQKVDAIDMSEYDVPMDYIVSEKNVYVR